VYRSNQLARHNLFLAPPVRSLASLAFRISVYNLLQPQTNQSRSFLLSTDNPSQPSAEALEVLPKHDGGARPGKWPHAAATKPLPGEASMALDSLPQFLRRKEYELSNKLL
jgi:hypothetical protein